MVSLGRHHISFAVLCRKEQTGTEGKKKSASLTYIQFVWVNSWDLSSEM